MTDGGKMVLVWSDEFAIGIPVVDQDHQELFGLYNDLEVLVADGADFDVISQKLDYVCFYCLSHFGHEARIMTETAFPGREGHMRAHADLQRAFMDLCTVYRVTKLRSDAERILGFLAGWLVQHTLGDDREIGVHVARYRLSAPDYNPVSSVRRRRPGSD